MILRLLFKTIDFFKIFDFVIGSFVWCIRGSGGIVSGFHFILWFIASSRCAELSQKLRFIYNILLKRKLLFLTVQEFGW